MNKTPQNEVPVEEGRHMCRQEIANLRQIVRGLEDEIREKLELLTKYQSGIN